VSAVTPVPLPPVAWPNVDRHAEWLSVVSANVVSGVAIPVKTTPASTKAGVPAKTSAVNAATAVSQNSDVVSIAAAMPSLLVTSNKVVR